jgi:lectin, mannose-binding 2
MPFWDFTGSTMVTTQFVRLTPDAQSKSGAIWNQVPLFNRNWEIHLNFKVHGKGKELFGDGMAFWYVKERLKDGPVFGSKDSFSGLAIILDTYSNHNGPHNVSYNRDSYIRF